MNWAWWDGKMPVEHYRHEHGLDAESLGDVEGAADHDAGASPDGISAKDGESKSPRK
jgi:hypothetical protein